MIKVKNNLDYVNLQIIFIIIWMLFFSTVAYAQTRSVDRPELGIGDSIPKELWNHPLQVISDSQGQKTITLADYRGKLIILDFWATWCSSCIAAMPRIHELEKQYKAEIVIIPVTYESVDKVATFLSTNHIVKSLGLFSVVNDEMLRATFPHRSVPYYIWISPTGIVSTATNAEQVNKQNIKLILDGENAAIPIRRDIDAKTPLFLSDVIELKDLSHYSVFTKGKYDGLPSGNRFRKEGDVIRGRALTNSSLMAIYQAAAIPLLEKMGDSFSLKRFLLNVADTTRLIPQKTTLGGYENLYNYELIVPVELADSLYGYMLQDLNRYTGYHGHIEKKEIKCLVLTKIEELNNIKTRGGKSENSLFYGKSPRLVNYPLSYLVMRLNGQKEIPLLVVDETGYTENVDLEFSGELDLITIKKELRTQGLDLVEGYRKINIFVLNEKK